MSQEIPTFAVTNERHYNCDNTYFQFSSAPCFLTETRTILHHFKQEYILSLLSGNCSAKHFKIEKYITKMSAFSIYKPYNIIKQLFNKLINAFRHTRSQACSDNNIVPCLPKHYTHYSRVSGPCQGCGE